MSAFRGKCMWTAELAASIVGVIRGVALLCETSCLWVDPQQTCASVCRYVQKRFFCVMNNSPVPSPPPIEGVVLDHMDDWSETEMECVISYQYGNCSFLYSSAERKSICDGKFLLRQYGRESSRALLAGRVLVDIYICFYRKCLSS